MKRRVEVVEISSVDLAIELLPSINAALNALATVLLVSGWVLIRQRRELAHKRVMLSAFGVSSVFLVCYLAYHYSLKARYGVAGIRFEGPSEVRSVYLVMLASHVILAAIVPFLAGANIYLGLKDRRETHRQLARWTLPIWLYVSITGVIIYAMLYHVYPASVEKSIIEQSQQAPAKTGAD